MIPRALRVAVAVAIAAAIFQPFYIRVFAVNRARMAANLLELPYRKTPGLRAFLEGVRLRTSPGDTIAIVAPPRSDYVYIFARASYVLAGRRLLNMHDAGSAPLVAAYRAGPAPLGFVVVWSNPDGMLLRRAP